MRAAGRPVYVVGGNITRFLGKGHPDFIWKKHPDFGKRENPALRDYITGSIRGALESTGVQAKSVDRVFVGNFAGELFNQQGHLGAAVADAHPGLLHKPSMRVEGACASGGLAAAAAAQAIQAGDDLVLACGAEMQTAASARDGGLFLARAADFHRQSGVDDFVFPCLLGRRAKAYADRFGGEKALEGLGHVAAKAYANAALNPLAQMRLAKGMTPEFCGSATKTNPNFLGNEEVKPFLRLTDCSQVSDGGAAMILASEEGLVKLGKSKADCAQLLACEYGAGNLYEDPADLTVMDTTRAVVDRLYAQTGLNIGDVGVAEVHDCFTIAEVLMMEAIGLCGHGEGAHAATSGLTARMGRLPVNTGGGLLAWGHPVGATGVKQILELFRQMKGQCGDYQLAERPEVGLAVNMGGDDKTCVATVLRNL